MNKFILLLSCLAGLTAAGVSRLSSKEGIVRERLELSRNNPFLGRDEGNILRLSQSELIRQKQILDLLLNIDQPLRIVELQELAGELVSDPSQYNGQIDEEMQYVLQLWRSQQLVGKQEVYLCTDDKHIRQFVGIYRILVRSIDWDTMLRNACALRDRINSVLFVNTLVLALRDRSDSENLIIPGLQEILPRMFYDENVLNRVQDSVLQNLNRKTETIRPTWRDIGLTRRQQIMERNPGLWGILEKQQLWKPWQLLRMDLAKQKLEQGIPSDRRIVQNKIVIPLNEDEQNTGMDLILKDVGLQAMAMSMGMAYQLDAVNGIELERDQLQGVFDEELPLMKHRRLMGSNIEDGRRVQDQDDLDDGNRLLRVGRRRIGKTIMPNQRQRLLTTMLNRSDWDVRGLPQTKIDDDRLLRIGRRRGINDGRRVALDDEVHWDIDSRLSNSNVPLSERLLHVGRRSGKQTVTPTQRQRLWNTMLNNDVRDGRFVRIDEDEMEEPTNIVSRRLQNWDIRGLPLRSVDNPRLLPVGRRNSIETSDIRSILEDQPDSSEQIRQPEILREQQSTRQNRKSQRQKQIEDRRSRIGSIQEWDIENLPLSRIDDERLLPGVRRRGQAEIPSRQRLLSTIRDVRNGRLVLDEDEEDQQDSREQNRRSENLREQLQMRQNRKSQRQQQIEDRRSRIGSIQEWDIENLPLSRIDDERLLPGGRHRGQSEIPSTRQRLLSTIRGVRNGRLVMDDDEEETQIDRQVEDIKRHLGGLTQDLNTVNLRDSHVGNDRLLRINRRRSGIQESRLGLLGRNIRDGRWSISEEIEPLDEIKESIGSRLQRMRQALSQRLQMARGIERQIEQREAMGVPIEPQEMEQIRQMQTRLQQRLDDVDVIENSIQTRLTGDQDVQIQRLAIKLGLTDDLSKVRSRSPRSISSNRDLTTKTVDGSTMLHTWQQFVALVNLNRFSLGLPIARQITTESSRINNPRLLQRPNELYTLRLNEKRLSEQSLRSYMLIISEYQKMLGQISVNGLRGTQDIDSIIGNGIHSRLLQMMKAALETVQQTKAIENISPITRLGFMGLEPIIHRLMEDVIKGINSKRHEIPEYTRQELELPGVSINKIDVDQLRTYIEMVESDMANIMQLRDEKQPKIVLKERRLNHEPFTLTVDITSERTQRAVVRVLLMPKVDGLGQRLPIEDIQVNSWILDATVTELIPGRNIIRLRSEDVAWTSRDTTPITDIYRRVMLALKGELTMTESRVIRNHCALPHRLLLPRGNINGLPMQMLVVISPVTEDVIRMRQKDIQDITCGLGTSTVNLDSLPLLYPLDRKLDTVDSLMMVPNIKIKDVLIYHDE